MISLKNAQAIRNASNKIMKVQEKINKVTDYDFDHDAIVYLKDTSAFEAQQRELQRQIAASLEYFAVDMCGGDEPPEDDFGRFTRLQGLADALYVVIKFAPEDHRGGGFWTLQECIAQLLDLDIRQERLCIPPTEAELALP